MYSNIYNSECIATPLQVTYVFLFSKYRIIIRFLIVVPEQMFRKHFIERTVSWIYNGDAKSSHSMFLKLVLLHALQPLLETLGTVSLVQLLSTADRKPQILQLCKYYWPVSFLTKYSTSFSPHCTLWNSFVKNLTQILFVVCSTEGLRTNARELIRFSLWS